MRAKDDAFLSAVDLRNELDIPEENLGSKVIVLSLVHIIEDKARNGVTNGDWSDLVLRELRRYGIPPDEFWEIQSFTTGYD